MRIVGRLFIFPLDFSVASAVWCARKRANRATVTSLGSDAGIARALEGRRSGRGNRSTPALGDLVQVRSRRWLVEEVIPQEAPGQSAIVRLACADDDAQGQALEVFWDFEID